MFTDKVLLGVLVRRVTVSLIGQRVWTLDLLNIATGIR